MSNGRRLSDGNCVRLRDKNGDYLTLLPCPSMKVGWVDLCRPHSVVLYCGVPIDLVNVFIEQFGLEPISPKETDTADCVTVADAAEFIFHREAPPPSDAVLHLCVPEYEYAPITSIKHEESDDGPGCVVLEIDPESEVAQALRHSCSLP